ncbi:hypothetical protein ScPMuIL_008912 [Solemya velum]
MNCSQCIFCLLLACQNLYSALGKSKTETLSGSFCPSRHDTYELSEGDTLTVQWFGDEIDCKIRLKTELIWGSPAVLCFKVQSFSLPNCQTELNFYDQWRGYTASKSYECDANLEGSEFCMESMGRIGIESARDSRANIKVEIYSKTRQLSNSKDYEPNHVPIIIGAVASFLCIGGIACIICIRLRAQRQAQAQSASMTAYQYQSAPQSVAAVPPQQYSSQTVPLQQYSSQPMPPQQYPSEPMPPQHLHSAQLMYFDQLLQKCLAGQPNDRQHTPCNITPTC